MLSDRIVKSDRRLDFVKSVQVIVVTRRVANNKGFPLNLGNSTFSSCGTRVTRVRIQVVLVEIEIMGRASELR